MRLIKTSASQKSYQLYTPDLPASWEVVSEAGEVVATLSGFTGMSGSGWSVSVCGKSLGRFVSRKAALAAIAKARGEA